MSEGQAVETPLEEGQEPIEAPATEEAVDPIKELGFEGPEAIAKAYSEERKKLTQQAQELASLKKSQARPPAREQVTDDDVFERPVASQRVIAKQEAERLLSTYKWEIQADMIRAKDPDTFDKLGPYMNKVAEANPHLDSDPSNMGLIFEKAKELRAQELKANLAELREVASPEELKAILGVESKTETDAEKLANMGIDSTTSAQTTKTPADLTDTDAVLSDCFAQYRQK